MINMVKHLKKKCYKTRRSSYLLPLVACFDLYAMVATAYLHPMLNLIFPLAEMLVLEFDARGPFSHTIPKFSPMFNMMLLPLWV